MQTQIQSHRNKKYLDQVVQIITSEGPNDLKFANINNIFKSYEEGKDIDEIPHFTNCVYAQEKEVFDL